MTRIAAPARSGIDTAQPAITDLLSRDVQRLWNAPILTMRDRKQLMCTLLEEVSLTVHREQYQAHLKLR